MSCRRCRPAGGVAAGEQHAAQLSRHSLELHAPWLRGIERRYLGTDRVCDPPEQLALVVHVLVERWRGNADVLGHTPHADAVESLPLEELESGVHQCLSIETSAHP